MRLPRFLWSPRRRRAEAEVRAQLARIHGLETQLEHDRRRRAIHRGLCS